MLLPMNLTSTFWHKGRCLQAVPKIRYVHLKECTTIYLHKQEYACTYKCNTNSLGSRFIYFPGPASVSCCCIPFPIFSTESWYQMHFSQSTSGATWWLLRSPNITAWMHTLTHTRPGTCLSHHVPEHPSWLQHFQRQLFKGQRHRDAF